MVHEAARSGRFFVGAHNSGSGSGYTGPGQAIHFQSRPDIRLVKMYGLPGTSILSPGPRLKRHFPGFREEGCFSPSGYRAATEKQPSSRNRSQERSNTIPPLCD